jgi:hypothetical protein
MSEAVERLTGSWTLPLVKREARHAIVYGVIANAIFYAVIALGIFAWHLLANHPPTLDDVLTPAVILYAGFFFGGLVINAEESLHKHKWYPTFYMLWLMGLLINFVVAGL